MAQSEEDELALFMVTASVLPDVPNAEEELPKSTEVIDDSITAPECLLKSVKEVSSKSTGDGSSTRGQQTI